VRRRTEERDTHMKCQVLFAWGVFAHVSLISGTLKAEPHRIEFAYDDATLDLTATRGAPIVDEDGRVVGSNIGMKTEGKKLIGVAQSATVVLAAVERALAAAAQPGVAPDGAQPRR
jgi:hypothetical protein